MKKLLLFSLLACLLSSCIVLPYGHDHADRWGAWHGGSPGRWH